MATGLVLKGVRLRPPRWERLEKRPGLDGQGDRQFSFLDEHVFGFLFRLPRVTRLEMIPSLHVRRDGELSLSWLPSTKDELVTPGRQGGEESPATQENEARV